jgi:hypothetical protein
MLSFSFEGEIKTFQNKYKLKKFIPTMPVLWKVLEGMPWIQEKKR